MNETTNADTPTGESLNLTTIADIWDLPAPQRMRCIRELAQMFEDLTTLEAAIAAKAGRPAAGMMDFQLPMRWTDDGLSESTTSLRSRDGVTVEVKMGEQR